MLIGLKKYLNPHKNSCSKVISILTTGHILHESSSAPRQHKSVQYKLLTLYLHRDVSHTDMLQLHFISCRGVSGGRRQHARIQGFLSYLVLSLFYSLQGGGSNGFIAEKTILNLYQGSRGGPLFFQGGVKLFPGRWGVQMLISLETHVRTCYFPGGCPDPLSPSGSAHGQCHHNGTIFITVSLLTIIVRH